MDNWSSNDRTTSEESDHKPPSIPSASTEVERTMSSKAPTSEETDITDSFISLNASKTHCKNQFWTKKKPPSQDCHATMLFVFSLFFFQTHDSNQSNHAVYSTHVIWLAKSAGLHSRAQHVIFRVIREVLEIFLLKYHDRFSFNAQKKKKKKEKEKVWRIDSSGPLSSLPLDSITLSRKERARFFFHESVARLRQLLGAWTSPCTVPAI